MVAVIAILRIVKAIPLFFLTNAAKANSTIITKHLRCAMDYINTKLLLPLLLHSYKKLRSVQTFKKSLTFSGDGFVDLNPPSSINIKWAGESIGERTAV